MRVLWFTGNAMPDINRHFGMEDRGTGGWMGALLEQMKEYEDIELGIVTATPQFPDISVKIDGVDYFVIHQKISKFRPAICSVDNKPEYLARCIRIIEQFKPDLIHIHGTERFYGSIVFEKLIDIPVIISIQGIMNACSEWYRWFGKMTLWNIFLATNSDTFRMSGLFWYYLEAKLRARREKLVFKKAKYFCGRTDWDRAYISFFNEHASYFHVGEIIRQPFWEEQWRLSECIKKRIIFTNARHPRKGTELLIEAFERLKQHYDDVELVLVGSLGLGGYGKGLKKIIDRLGKQVKVLGRMNATEIAEELGKSHVFVSPSYIDNSPNSLAEAQLVGMPVIASYTGGVPSMVKDGVDGLLFPTGDVPLLVEKIRIVFENDELAMKLGANAKRTAKKRHDSGEILEAQLMAYHNALDM